MSECPHKGCHAPDMSCPRGEDLEDCPKWKSRAATAESGEPDAVASGPSERQLRFPWTGNVMGSTDLPYLAGATRTRLLTMAGASDAGKTSLLAAFYLLIARGARPDGVEFAGSLTLEGWENIAGSLRWSASNGPAFPAHTSSGGGRWPGMLHMSLRTQQGDCELVAADGPGEWFSDWALSEMSPRAEGARWLAERTDVFLVIADSQALAGESRGQARVALTDLLRRVGTNRGERPVAVVWTKYDIPVSQGIQTAVREAAQRSLKEFKEFSVSMHPPAAVGDARDRGQGILELLGWIISVQPTRRDEVEAEAEDTGKTLLRTFGTFA